RHSYDEKVAVAEGGRVVAETQVQGFGDLCRGRLPRTVAALAQFADPGAADIEAESWIAATKGKRQRQADIAEPDDGDSRICGSKHCRSCVERQDRVGLLPQVSNRESDVAIRGLSPSGAGRLARGG